MTTQIAILDIPFTLDDLIELRSSIADRMDNVRQISARRWEDLHALLNKLIELETEVRALP